MIYQHYTFLLCKTYLHTIRNLLLLHLPVTYRAYTTENIAPFHILLLLPPHRKPLPEIIEGQHVQNELDRQLRFYRESEMEYIKKEATKLRESATDIHETLSEVEGYLAQLRNLCVEVSSLMVNSKIILKFYSEIKFRDLGPSVTGYYYFVFFRMKGRFFRRQLRTCIYTGI